MHLQENSVFNLDLGSKVTRDVAQCPQYHVTYAPANFEVAASIGSEVNTFTKNTLFDF